MNYHWKLRFWYSGHYGLIRQWFKGKKGCFTEIIMNGQWVSGSPYVLDAITGMGEDSWSCGEMAHDIASIDAIEIGAKLGVDVFRIDGEADSKSLLAMKTAILAHGKQLYGEQPYAVHLDSVQEIISRFGFAIEEKIVIAGWLHDTVEDTHLKLEDIALNFGPDIADIVYRLTDEPGVDRHERKTKTYPKIRGHREATIVKLCDRIANVEASRKVPKKFQMYRNEHGDFRKAVFVPGIADAMWAHLDGLLHPASGMFKAVKALMDEPLPELPVVEDRHNTAPMFECRPPCSKCGAAASTIQLFNNAGKWRLIYEGSDSGNGSGGDITPDRARAIIAGFTEPYLKERIRAADFYDDGGFCLECSWFYCPTHWNISTTGGGRCPEGHFKSLDPHWSPE